MDARKGSVLIAALSARALAQAAKRAGYIPLVADLFGDLDTQDAAFASRTIRGSLAGGFDFADMKAALDDLAGLLSEMPIGVVCGAGFERHPEQLARLAARWPLIGCSPECVRTVKDPFALKATLDSLGIPSPAVAPYTSLHKRWLSKSRGGSGGGHVRFANGQHSTGDYLQDYVEGRSISALCLGTTDGAQIIGFSEQWTSRTPDAPFRYGGAVRIDDPPPPGLKAVLAEIEAHAPVICKAFHLRGLFGIDCIAGPPHWQVIEINPRPGATLDIFDMDGTNLFDAHIRACSGHLPRIPSCYKGSKAAGVAYAGGSDFTIPASIAFPDWVADRPVPGSVIGSGEPICTVTAVGGDEREAREQCEKRVRLVETGFLEAVAETEHWGSNDVISTGAD